jgi:hypothetical protein
VTEEDSMTNYQNRIAVAVLVCFVGGELTPLRAATSPNSAAAEPQEGEKRLPAAVETTSPARESEQPISESAVKPACGASRRLDVGEVERVADMRVDTRVGVSVLSSGPIGGQLRAIRDAHLVVLPDRDVQSLKFAAEPGQQVKADGRKLGNKTKTLIWAAALTVGIVWAYKTFSVTRGTD